MRGLQDPPVCGAHGPRLLPAERPSFLQAVPREAECRRVLLRAPPGPGGPALPAGPRRGPFPDSVPLPDLLSHTFLLSHNRDQPVTSATGPEPPPPRPPPSSKVGVAGDSAPQTFTSSFSLGTGSLPHHARGAWLRGPGPSERVSRDELGRVSRWHPVSLAVTL